MTNCSPWKTAFAPATVANLGPGFDVLGLAIDPKSGLGDTCEARLESTPGISITVSGDAGRLPTDPKLNVASVAAAKVLEAAGVSTGLSLRLHKGLPLGSGLGSSAASAASAAIATNSALGNPLSREELIDAGRAGEAVAAGHPHPDNVVPALLGGILLMVDDEKSGLNVVRLPVPDQLRVIVVIPDLEVRTADARAAIPPSIPVADAVANIGRMGLLISGLYDNDMKRLGLGIQDRLHQPYRTPLVKGYDVVAEAGTRAGAIAVGLSGSGPAIFALIEGDSRGEQCGQSLVNAFHSQGVNARYVVGSIASST